MLLFVFIGNCYVVLIFLLLLILVLLDFFVVKVFEELMLYVSFSFVLLVKLYFVCFRVLYKFKFFGVVFGSVELVNIVFILVCVLFILGKVVFKVILLKILFWVIFVWLKDWSKIVVVSRIIINIIIVIVGKINFFILGNWVWE